jgi:hypothetical protein
VKICECGSDHWCHDAALFRFQLTLVNVRIRIVVSAAAAAPAVAVVTHAEHVTQFVGDDKGRREAVLANENATARRVAYARNGRVA